MRNARPVRCRSLLALGLLGAAAPQQALSHVKWFSSYDTHAHPVAWEALLGTQWLILSATALATVFAACWIANRTGASQVRPFAGSPTLQRPAWAYPLIFSALAITILLCWKHEVILAPELKCELGEISALQFLVIAISLIPRLSVLFPFGVGLLFLSGVYEFGLFHMLDYVFVLGSAAFLWMTRAGTHPSDFQRALTILYRTTGFSLCWVGVEKVIYPHWAEEILQARPDLALGLPNDFFIQGAALFEFSLGFFFLAQLWTRACALVLTGLMIFTTSLFGFREVLGHLLLHAILLTFMICGPARVLAHSCSGPIRPALKLACMYAVLLAGSTLIYHRLAWLLMPGEA
ncbi:DoxX family membrane protein [Allohahella sp. A8]|uniref:DoxX family membrane protein n=1 Tax=Allohahella sp. A8 TaxID=3141461 RepID=UPI003A7FB3EA